MVNAGDIIGKVINLDSEKKEIVLAPVSGIVFSTNTHYIGNVYKRNMVGLALATIQEAENELDKKARENAEEGVWAVVDNSRSGNITINSINVAVGEDVKKNDLIGTVTNDSNKKEQVFAPIAGTIKAVLNSEYIGKSIHRSDGNLARIEEHEAVKKAREKSEKEYKKAREKEKEIEKARENARENDNAYYSILNGGKSVLKQNRKHKQTKRKHKQSKRRKTNRNK
jgi:hypothetical protein